ncbi:MAG: hypothetical protein GY861_09220 [bacterium]|nr:hypothetical protein [bacterium]
MKKITLLIFVVSILMISGCGKDELCKQKVTGEGACEALGIGYEYDSSLDKCVEQTAGGCTFEIPFTSLAECQRTCEGKEVFCGRPTAGPGYDVSNCDTSCSADADCKFGCGCGPINKDESCKVGDLERIACEQTNVKCKDNKCVEDNYIVACTKDCRQICDVKLECCFDQCVPGSCEEGGKDVAYYEEQGFLMENNAISDWPACIEMLQ